MENISILEVNLFSLSKNIFEWLYFFTEPIFNPVDLIFIFKLSLNINLHLIIVWISLQVNQFINIDFHVAKYILQVCLEMTDSVFPLIFLFLLERFNQLFTCDVNQADNLIIIVFSVQLHSV